MGLAVIFVFLFLFLLGLAFSCFIVFSSFLITLLLLSFEPADIDFCSPMAARPNFGISLLGNNCTLYGHCGVGVLCLQPVFFYVFVA